MHFRSLSLSVNETRSLSYTQADVEIPTIQSAADLYKKMFLQGDRKAMNSMIDRALILTSALLLAFGTSPSFARADKPNVLLIAVDDLNDWVGCLGGHSQTHTPNIDRLAARGMLFTNAHCQGAICNGDRIDEQNK